MSFIGTQPGYAYNTITKETFNGTGSQTDFPLSVPATTNGLEVFVENVQQEPTTAYTVSGTTLTFLAAPVSGTGNIYVVHRNPTVQTLIPPSDIAVNVASITTTGSAIIGDGLTVDNDGATVATFDRATSDGTIIDIQKDGSSVGSIGAKSSDLTIGTDDTGLRFYDAGDAVLPYNLSTQASPSNTIDLGDSGSTFKDLYLSGGVYLGGTTSTNHLDDYEEGTWSPYFTSTGGGSATMGSNTEGLYIKTGNVVYVTASLEMSSNSLSSGGLEVRGLPFTPSGNS